MLGSIRAEIRKLITVRSTYVIIALILIFVAINSFYVEGYWGQSGSAAGNLLPLAIKEVVSNSVGVAALFISIIAILQVGHEYRHNTIMHTLTANARRSQVFLAKALVLGVFGIVIGLFTAGFSLAAYYFGLSLRDAVLPAQEVGFIEQLPKVVVYSFVYAMAGFLVALLVRSIVVAVVIMLILPSTIEPLLGLLLKDNAVYLPISTFDHILGVAVQAGDLSSNRAVILSIIYIGMAGMIAWLLFVRRDAK